MHPILSNNSNYNFIEVSYWHLLKYSCVRVERNTDWFKKRFPAMESFWRDVCFYRNVGIDILKDKLNKNKKNKFIDPSLNEDTEKNCISINGYQFKSDDDDSDSEMEEEDDNILVL